MVSVMASLGEDAQATHGNGYGYGNGYECPPHATGVHVQIQNEDREGFIFATAAEPHF